MHINKKTKDGNRKVKESTNQSMKKTIISGIAFILLSGIVLISVYLYSHNKATKKGKEEVTSSTFAMDTIITQQAYGINANEALQAVNIAAKDYENRLSMFSQDSEIAKINESAGAQGVEVSAQTIELLEKSKRLSATSQKAFAITIAPITQAWGITTNTPRVVPQNEIEALLPLVDDSKIEIEGTKVTLHTAGMGVDLGGIAKGAFCSVAQEIYNEYDVQSALISIGGNIYVKGRLPNGNQYRVGFRDPNNGENSYIASFGMEDEVIAVSGGYERFFEIDGKTYIHIIDPRTGMPAESDIVSVGAITKDGAEADFYSTTLFVLGKEKALEYMKAGLKVIMLDENNVLYVSDSLKDTFTLNDSAKGTYSIEFVDAEG